MWLVISQTNKNVSIVKYVKKIVRKWKNFVVTILYVKKDIKVSKIIKSINLLKNRCICTKCAIFLKLQKVRQDKTKKISFKLLSCVIILWPNNCSKTSWHLIIPIYKRGFPFVQYVNGPWNILITDWQTYSNGNKIFIFICWQQKKFDKFWHP